MTDPPIDYGRICSSVMAAENGNAVVLNPLEEEGSHWQDHKIFNLCCSETIIKLMSTIQN